MMTIPTKSTKPSVLPLSAKVVLTIETVGAKSLAPNMKPTTGRVILVDLRAAALARIGGAS